MVNVGQHASQVQAYGSHALSACMGAAQVIIFAREAAADHFSGPLELLLQTRALIIPDSEGSQNLDTMLDSPESPRRWAWPRLEPRLGHVRDRSLPGKLAGELRGCCQQQALEVGTQNGSWVVAARTQWSCEGVAAGSSSCLGC